MKNTPRYPSIPKGTKGQETFYEFPLNPQVRSYLRIEHLLKRLDEFSTFTNPIESELYFQSLFGLCSLLTQVHVRGDLVKDLTRQRERFKTWATNPDIDTKYLDNLCTQSYILQQQLLQAPRLGQSLREDLFLQSFRQRFEVPAGICSFDAPHLHFWLDMPKEHLSQCAKKWNQELNPIRAALDFWLSMTRQGCELKRQTVHKGIYQQQAPDSHLVQVRISTEYNVYPTVSNYKSRFTLRLTPFNEEDAIAPEISVSLAAF